MPYQNQSLQKNPYLRLRPAWLARDKIGFRIYSGTSLKAAIAELTQQLSYDTFAHYAPPDTSTCHSKQSWRTRRAYGRSEFPTYSDMVGSPGYFSDLTEIQVDRKRPIFVRNPPIDSVGALGLPLITLRLFNLSANLLQV